MAQWLVFLPHNKRVFDPGACRVISCGVSLTVLSVSVFMSTKNLRKYGCFNIVIDTGIVFYFMLKTQNFQVSVSASAKAI